MEFWGVECKPGACVSVEPGSDMIVHISQAALGESKNKGDEPIYLYLVVDDVKYTIGTLFQGKCPQLSSEILLEKGFELSHSWKHGSVYFTGYKVDAREDDEEEEGSDDELPVVSEKEKPKPDAVEVKPEVKKTDPAKSGTKQVNFKVPNEEDNAMQDDDDSDEDSDDDMSSSEDSSDDEDKKAIAGGDGDEDSDGDETSADETPKKTEQQSKKRPADVPKTPAPAYSEKKAKFATPQKTGYVHEATPHPAKQKQKTANHQCSSCKRSFTSEVGLQSHTKAKHAPPA
ncbi:PREDICTED: histone deacetylase HDT3 isoform X2 [Tarenaya hassleriana]|uniref:histone deacetylase HDT3 isoform X2 n=1 Tax=Tarenaya hassleriana TaxID=28532 RepID=UPI00053CA835|nr:PREDICTED: histone deacetylase HDT3 isoform X2 [Tarenaya hassleriana]